MKHVFWRVRAEPHCFGMVKTGVPVALHLREPVINRTQREYFRYSFYLGLLTLPCLRLPWVVCTLLFHPTLVGLLLPFFSCLCAAGYGQEEATGLCAATAAAAALGLSLEHHAASEEGKCELSGWRSRPGIPIWV